MLNKFVKRYKGFFFEIIEKSEELKIRKREKGLNKNVFERLMVLEMMKCSFSTIINNVLH